MRHSDIALPGTSPQSKDVSAAEYRERVGIIAREDPEDARRVAEERFPEDRKGQIAHVLADEVARYLGDGLTTSILDIPPSEDELRHTAVVFERARGRTQALDVQAR